MRAARLRFGLALALFLLWIGWLAYLVARQSREQVLSRPQALAADALVLAELQAAPNGRPEVAATVKQVLAMKDGVKSPEGVLVVTGLPEAAGFKGSGTYLVPLSRSDGAGGTFQLTRVPRSPGYPPGFGQPRSPVYRWGPDLEAQLREVRGP